VDFLQYTVFDDRDAGFLGSDVDENFFAHAAPFPIFFRIPASSWSGKPMTPE
jgi:hypothetical protein